MISSRKWRLPVFLDASTVCCPRVSREYSVNGGHVMGYSHIHFVSSLVAGIGYVFPNIRPPLTSRPSSTDIACSVGALYLYSGDNIRKHTANSLEAALSVLDDKPGPSPTDASALLFLSPVPRFTKGPIPAILTVTSAHTGPYYGKAI